MRFIIVYFRVEDIAERHFSQEQVADPPDTLCIFVLRPHFSEASHCREGRLEFLELFRDALVGSRALLADLSEQFSIIDDESDDGFTVVFGDILGLVAGLALIQVPRLETTLLFG